MTVNQWKLFFPNDFVFHRGKFYSILVSPKVCLTRRIKFSPKIVYPKYSIVLSTRHFPQEIEFAGKDVYSQVKGLCISPFYPIWGIFPQINFSSKGYFPQSFCIPPQRIRYRPSLVSYKESMNNLYLWSPTRAFPPTLIYKWPIPINTLSSNNPVLPGTGVSFMHSFIHSLVSIIFRWNAWNKCNISIYNWRHCFFPPHKPEPSPLSIILSTILYHLPS